MAKNQNPKNEVVVSNNETPSVENQIENTSVEVAETETVIENQVTETVIEKVEYVPMTREEQEAFATKIQADFKGVSINRAMVEELEAHPEVKRIQLLEYEKLNFVETAIDAFVRRMRVNFNSKIDHRMTAHILELVDAYNEFAVEKGIEKLTKEDFKYLRNNAELKLWLESKEDKKKGSGTGPKTTEEINKYSRERKMAERAKEKGFVKADGTGDVETYQACKTYKLTKEEFIATGLTPDELPLLKIAEANKMTVAELKEKLSKL